MLRSIWKPSNMTETGPSTELAECYPYSLLMHRSVKSIQSSPAVGLRRNDLNPPAHRRQFSQCHLAMGKEMATGHTENPTPTIDYSFVVCSAVLCRSRILKRPAMLPSVSTAP